MKYGSVPPSSWCVSFLALVSISLLSGDCVTCAQENTQPTQPPTLNLRVIEGIHIEKDGRTITYQRVEPPVLPPKPVATPAPVIDPTQVLVLTAEQQRRAAKRSEMLFFTATVYDHSVTGLRWSQQGREYRAWSDVDFNHLAGVSEIETADHIYQLLFVVSNFTTAQVQAFNGSVTERGLPASVLKPLPPVFNSSANHAEYLLVPHEAAPAPAPEVPALLDALHTHYDAHRFQLAEAAEQRETERLTHEQWLRDHPPVPKDTVISFWPKEIRTNPAPTN